MNDKLIGVDGKMVKVQWILGKLMILLEEKIKTLLVLINDNAIDEKFKIL